MLHGDRSRGSFSAWIMAVGEGAADIAAGVPGAVTSFGAGVVGAAAAEGEAAAGGVAAAAGGEAGVASVAGAAA